MRAGQLRQRVTIESPTETQGSTGAITTTWSEVDTVWAAVEPASGTERWVQSLDVRLADRMTRVRMRYRDDVDETMRITFGDLMMNVERIINQWSRDRELIILCSEVNPAEA